MNEEKLIEKPRQDSPFAIWHWSIPELVIFFVLHTLLGWAATFIFFSTYWW